MRTTTTRAAAADTLRRVGVPSVRLDPTPTPFFGEGGPAVQPGTHVPLTSAAPRRTEHGEPDGAGGVPRPWVGSAGQFS